MEFFRAVPVIMLMIFCFYGVFSGMDELSSRTYWSVVLALTLYNGAVLAEVFRAGINAVPRGQAEAAYAIGMRKSQVMRPDPAAAGREDHDPGDHQPDGGGPQGHRPRLRRGGRRPHARGKQIYPQFQNHVPTIIVIGAMYVIVNLLLTWLAMWVQRRLVGEKKVLEVRAWSARHEPGRPTR